jgi:hypothetical protein
MMPAMASERTAARAEELDSGEQADNEHGAADTDGAAEQGQEGSFQEKLKENIAVGGAEGFAQANLVGALTDGDEHDVDDADGT